MVVGETVGFINGDIDGVADEGLLVPLVGLWLGAGVGDDVALVGEADVGVSLGAGEGDDVGGAVGPALGLCVG
jgi:hypothetical protein